MRAYVHTFACMSASSSAQRQSVVTQNTFHLLCAFCQVLVPFSQKATANHKELRTSLYGMHAEDTACVSQALEKACSLLEHQYGKDAKGSQVVLVVDGGPSLREMRQLETMIPRLPRSVAMHIIAMGSEVRGASLPMCACVRSMPLAV